jgi:hypothetical protein
LILKNTQAILLKIVGTIVKLSLAMERTMLLSTTALNIKKPNLLLTPIRAAPIRFLNLARLVGSRKRIKLEKRRLKRLLCEA